MEARFSSDTDQLRVALAALEEDLQRARARLDQAHEQIADLDRRKSEAADVASLAERAISELEGRVTAQREALAHSRRVEEKRNELAARLAERDAAANEAASAVDVLLGRLDELAARREAVAAAGEAVRALSGERAEMPPEPSALLEQWERLTERVSTQLGRELETQLIEAAARSPLGNAIEDLPAHLRILATERRRALIRESSRRRDPA